MLWMNKKEARMRGFFKARGNSYEVESTGSTTITEAK